MPFSARLEMKVITVCWMKVHSAPMRYTAAVMASIPTSGASVAALRG